MQLDALSKRGGFACECLSMVRSSPVADFSYSPKAPNLHLVVLSTNELNTAIIETPCKIANPVHLRFVAVEGIGNKVLLLLAHPCSSSRWQRFRLQCTALQ